MREINTAGLELLKRFEGCKLTAYTDKSGVWTIGWGSTEKMHPEIKQGLSITLPQAEEYLKKDLERFYHLDHYLSEHVNDNQFSALVCLAYNIGLGRLKTSTLIIKINAGDDPSKEWLSFDMEHINGVLTRVQGLLNRRKAELELYHKVG